MAVTVAAALAWTGCAVAQQASSLFALSLPDISPGWFDGGPGGKTLVEIPNRRIERLTVLVRDVEDRRILSGSYRVLINGKGSGNVFDTRAVKDGAILVMDPANLSMRPDELFDARENTVEVVAKDRRGRVYYQNWVVRTRSGDSNPYFSYAVSLNPDDPNGIAPDILLSEPRIPPVIGTAQGRAPTTIKGTLTSSAPGSSLTVNGKPVIASAASATAEFSAAVPLGRSDPEIRIEARDRKGHKCVVVIPVVIQQKSAPKFRFPGKRYALVIGISRYGSGSGAPPMLPGAAAAAQEFASFLQSNAGFPAENVRLLTDEKATIDQVRLAFSDFVSKAQANDLLIVYVIAHGLHDPRSGKGENVYLATYGMQMDQIDSTALNFTDLNLAMDRSVRCNQTFLIFDVGHDIKGDWRFSGRNLVNNRLLNLFSDQHGRSVIVSGGADEVSQGASGDPGGFFNRWMLEGLKGGADLNLDGVVSASELFRFVAAKVQGQTNAEQTPRFRLASKASEAPIGSLP